MTLVLLGSTIRTVVRLDLRHTDTGEPATATFDIDSRDIGSTQGTTIRFHNEVIATYRPGTRHHSTAVECARTLLTTATERTLTDHGRWDPDAFRAHLADAITEEKYTPWDSTTPNTLP